MSLEDEQNLFMMGDGCPLHGDEHIKECAACGAEFCSRCFPQSLACPECAQTTEDDDPLDDDHYNEELSGLKEYKDLLDDDEIERMLNETKDIPEEDLKDEEGHERDDNPTGRGR